MHRVDDGVCHVENARFLAANIEGARYVEIDGPLSLDIDTPDDLLLVEQLMTETVDAHR